MRWRTLLLGAVLGFAVSLPASARFLQTDPIRYGDGMNLYAYCLNDPLGCVDPTGLDSFLISRRVEVNVFGFRADTGGRHMFVMTNVHELGQPDGTRFSGGPNGPGDASLVPLTGVPSATDRDDAAAWDSAATDRSVNSIRISSSLIPDPVMEAVGNAAIGNPDYDVGALPGGNDGANSDSFARAIVDQAAIIAGVDPTSIPNSDGWHPNIDQADAVDFDPAGLEEARRQNDFCIANLGNC